MTPVRSTLKWGVRFVLFSAVLAVIWLIFLRTQSDVTAIHAEVVQWKDKLRLIRWTIILSIYFLWNNIVDLGRYYYKYSEEQATDMKTFRTRALIYLVSIELLIVEALPARLLEAV